MSKAKWMACSLLLSVLAFSGQAFSSAVATTPKVVVLELDGIISPASSDFLIRGMERAEQENAVLIVIEMDTPGGLDISMRSIIRQILSSSIPVASFVSPGGARAASAGTFILYASHIAAMTPASNLGAASPVSIGLAGPDNKPQADTDKDAEKKSGGDTMIHKVTNDAAAYIRSLAQLRGRNADFAEKAVLDASSLSAQEALKAGVIDLIAANVDELLKQLDGKSVKLDKGKIVSLRTAEAQIVRITPDWRNRIMAWLANPQLALILMMVGIYGLFFEITNPGVALPGVAGLICLLLGLYAFQMLPVNWAGVALVAVGTAMMIAEAFLPSFGVLGVGGIIAFVLGGVFLTDTGMAEFDLSIPFLIGAAIASAAVIMLIGTMAARSRSLKVVSGKEEMLGIEGVVASVAEGLAYANVRGESWRVRCDESLSPGDRIRVVAMDGLTLQVIHVGQGAATRH